MKTKTLKTNLLLCATLALLTGCLSPGTHTVADTLTAAGVEFAACKLAQKKPASTVWLNMAGSVFEEFGRNSPPDPNELADALNALPVGLDDSETRLVWAGSVAAYSMIYSPGLGPEKKARLQQLLTLIGNALQAGSQCGGATVAARGSQALEAGASPADAEDVGNAVAKALKQ